MRTKRTNGSTTYEYVYNGSRLTQMTINESGTVRTLYFVYDASGPIAFNVTSGTSSTTYYYVKNAQGDITAIVNKAGTAVVTYSYDAWGNLLSIDGEYKNGLGLRNPLRYRGYVYDTETGFYYLQSRYYDPQIGRFVNADNYVSTGGILGFNMFTYCSNNPVNYFDPAGTDAVYFADIIIYALSGALPGLIAGISSIMASIEAALATVAVPVICITAVAVAITAVVCLVEATRELLVLSEQVIDWVKTQIEATKLKEGSLHGYSVYVIAIKGTTDVVYVGMTMNYHSRQYAHQRKPGAKFPIASYSMMPVATGLSYKDARALEQTLITAFTLDALCNLINSIAEKNLYKFVHEFERIDSLISGSVIPD